MNTLSVAERQAVILLAEYEVVKVAAGKRYVSEHTEKNQIKSAMAKMGVKTQIGLMKRLFKEIYGVEWNLEHALRVAGTLLLLCLYVTTLGQTDQITRRSRRSGRGRNEVELITEL